MKSSPAAKLMGGAFATLLCQNKFVNEMIIKQQIMLNKCNEDHDHSHASSNSGSGPSEYELKHA